MLLNQLVTLNLWRLRHNTGRTGPFSKILFLEVDGRGFADLGEIAGQPRIGAFSADFKKMSEKIPRVVQSARSRKLTDDVLGFDDVNASGALPEFSSPQESLNPLIRNYQELCQELIASGTGQPRSAAAIAGELMHAGARVRLSLAQVSK